MHELLRTRSFGVAEPALEFARELVRTPSPSLDELRVATAVERTMRQSGFDRVVRDDYGNVLGILFGIEAGPTVLLVAHMDTVEPAAPDTWRHAPHSGCTEDGRLFAVGAADCKGGIAAQLYAGVALKRSLLPLRGNLVVAATVAEENGAALGVRALVTETLPQLGLAPTYAVLGEPTDLGMYYGHEGCVQLDIHVQGRDRFVVTDAAQAVFQDFSKHGGAGRANNGKQNQAVCAPCYQQNGDAGHALVRLTRRVLQSESVSDVVAQTKHSATASVRTAGAVGAEVQVAQERQQLSTGQVKTVPRITQPWCTDPFSALAQRARQALAAAGCTARPGQWSLDRLGMGTAGGALVNDLGIPTIGYGPGNEQAAHARDEYVEVGNIREAILGTASIVHSLIGVPVYGWTAEEI